MLLNHNQNATIPYSGLLLKVVRNSKVACSVMSPVMHKEWT